jgi:hypothetical protein
MFFLNEIALLACHFYTRALKVVLFERNSLPDLYFFNYKPLGLYFLNVMEP